MIEAIRKWLADFPRRAWTITYDEGCFVVLGRRSTAEKTLKAWDGDESFRIDRFGWMRPSEVDALPEA